VCKQHLPSSNDSASESGGDGRGGPNVYLS